MCKITNKYQEVLILTVKVGSENSWIVIVKHRLFYILRGRQNKLITKSERFFILSSVP